MKKGDLFKITKDVKFSRHKLFNSLPIYHQYEYISVRNKKRFGRKKHFQLEFFEGPEDLAEKEGIWFSSSFSMREYNRKREQVPAKYYKWTSEKILVNLLKNDIIKSTTYQEIARSFLNEKRV